MSVTVTVGIVLYNSAAELPGSLEALAPDHECGFAEVVLVDNASPDDSVAVARRLLPTAEVICARENRGFAAGANAALRAARGRYVLLLNPDVIPPPGGLRSLVAWMDAHPAITIASPELKDNDGNWQSPGRALPSIWRTVLELTRLHRLLPAAVRGRLLRGSYWTGGDQFDVGWVPGTAIIVRSDALGRAGLLREDLFMYGEDLEWCVRVRRAGGRVGVCADTTFTHADSASANRSWGQDETRRRIAAGIDAACRILYGDRHARALALLTSAAFGLEGHHPRRPRDHRERARASADVWLQLAARRGMQ